MAAPASHVLALRMILNGDGKVSREEFDGSDGAFARCDANGDGMISRADGVE